MMLSTRARYAVMAMVDLARTPGDAPVTLATLSERQDIPLAYLEQIFAQLRKSGLVRSVRGPGGGYALAGTREDTRISDILVAVEEPIRQTRCAHESVSGCLSDKTRCLTHDLWEGLGNQIFDYLHGISLADVCARHIPGVPQGTMFAGRPESGAVA